MKIEAAVAGWYDPTRSIIADLREGRDLLMSNTTPEERLVLHTQHPGWKRGDRVYLLPNGELRDRPEPGALFAGFIITTNPNDGTLTVNPTTDAAPVRESVEREFAAYNAWLHAKREQRRIAQEHARGHECEDELRDKQHSARKMLEQMSPPVFDIPELYEQLGLSPRDVHDSVEIETACPDCGGTGKVALFTSTEPCRRCSDG